MTSSSLGAVVYPVVGDSPWSYYYFDYGTTIEPASPGSPTTPTASPARRPTRAPAGLGRAADPRLAGHAARARQPSGQLRRGVPAGRAAELGAWADVVYEEARVTQVDEGTSTSGPRHQRLAPRAPARLHVALAPVTPGTQVSPLGAASCRNGRYTAPMTMVLAAAERVEIAGRHSATGQVLPGNGSVVTRDGERGSRDSHAVQGPLAARQDRRPVQPLGSRDPHQRESSPHRSVVDAAGTVRAWSSVVRQTIDPPEYQTLLAPRDVAFELRAQADDSLVLAANGTQGDPFEIRPGLSLPARSYYGRSA